MFQRLVQLLKWSIVIESDEHDRAIVVIRRNLSFSVKLYNQVATGSQFKLNRKYKTLLRHIPSSIPYVVTFWRGMLNDGDVKKREVVSNHLKLRDEIADL